MKIIRKIPKLSQSCLPLLVLLLAGLLAVPVHSQENPPGRVARLSYTHGSVSIQASGQDQWSQASVNYTVTTGDRLYTDQGSRGELEVGTYAVRLAETTDLTFANLNDQTMQLGLGQGSIRVSVLELPSNNDVEIDTPNGALTVTSPGRYRVDTDPNNDTTIVTVNSGSLQVSGGGADQTVQAGQVVQLTGSNPVQVASAPSRGPDDFDQWSSSRDRRLQQSSSARYVSRSMPGYSDLDTYGRWDNVPEYGPVWYPSGVSADWVPYRYGRWAWIDPWGWTWVEDEPWGFAPFHYGRWARIGPQWCWVPGPVAVAPVYAPALVAFVGGSGFSVGISVGGGGGLQGWFPLGPREPYVPWYRHGGDYARQVNVTNVRNVTNVTNINNVTNVNNIQYVNRNVATTAVPVNTFRSGQPVAHQVVRVAPQQLARTQVVAKPTVAPVRQATMAGKPVSAPRVRANPRVIAARTGARPGVPGASTTQPPAAARPGAPANAPVRPGAPAARTTQPPAVTKPGAPSGPPSGARAPAGRPPTTRPPVITRTPPPAPAPSQPNRAPTPAPGARNPSTERTAPERTAPPRTEPQRTPPHVITRETPPPRNAPTAAPPASERPARPPETREPENDRAARPAPQVRRTEVPPRSAPAPEARPARPAPSERAAPAARPEPRPAPSERAAPASKSKEAPRPGEGRDREDKGRP